MSDGNGHVLKAVEYVRENGRSRFGAWFASLDPVAAARVTAAIVRLEGGNLTQTKSVGGGVREIRIHTGPGYRVYFGRHGRELVILLAGGSKRGQRADIERAQADWLEFKTRGEGTWH